MWPARHRYRPRRRSVAREPFSLVHRPASTVGPRVDVGRRRLDQNVIFSTFTPEDELDPDLLAEGLCKLRGNAKTYTVLLINGNPSSGDQRYFQHGADIDIISDVTVTVGADGRLGAEAMADNAVPQPVMERMAVPVRINTWKEE